MSVKIVVPDLGESVVEATVGEWLKKEGDPVQAGEPLVSLETDKVDLDVSATQSGILGKIQRQTGEDVQTGDLLVVIEDADGQAPSEEAEAKQADVPEAAGEEVAPEATPREEAKAAQPAPEADSARAERATPVAKRMAAEKGVDIAEITGAGPGGRVTKADVESYVQGQQTAETAAPAQPSAPARREAPAPQPSPAPSPNADREERIRMSRRRRTIAERLVSAQQTAAMLTTFNEVDMKAVMDMRQRRRDDFKTREGVGLGFMSFFVKATIGALKQFPQLNASIEENEIVLKHYYDIGIAVGAEEGLVVPVLRDADRMTFAQIEKGIADMVEKV